MLRLAKRDRSLEQGRSLGRMEECGAILRSQAVVGTILERRPNDLRRARREVPQGEGIHLPEAAGTVLEHHPTQLEQVIVTIRELRNIADGTGLACLSRARAIAIKRQEIRHRRATRLRAPIILPVAIRQGVQPAAIRLARMVQIANNATAMAAGNPKRETVHRHRITVAGAGTRNRIRIRVVAVIMAGK